MNSTASFVRVRLTRARRSGRRLGVAGVLRLLGCSLKRLADQLATVGPVEARRSATPFLTSILAR